MSTPAKAATQTAENKSENVENKTETFADKVDAALGAVITDPDSGKKSFPDGTPEEVVFAANAELRRRETQGAFTKAQQELKQKETELETVQKFSRPTPKLDLTPEQREELEDLKLENPDKWRRKMNQLENDAIMAADKEHKQKVADALRESELARRAVVLENFQKENPELVITDSVIDNDVPPRYRQRLESGEITFETFLAEVKSYLSQGKTVQKERLENGQPNLSEVGGSSEPGDTAVELSDKEQYETEIF